MEIKAFREKYPMYDQLDDADLSQRLYDKHYKDQLSFDEFSTKFGYTTPEPVARASWEDTLKAPTKSWPDTAKAMVGSALFHFGESGRRDIENMYYEDGQFKLQPLPEYAKVGRDMYATAQKGIESKRPQDMSFMQELTYDTQMMLGRMAPVIAGGMATGGQSIGAMIPMFMQVRAERYTALRANGMSHTDATLHSDMSGLIEVGTEMTPIGWMMKRGTPFVKRIIQGTIGEGMLESVSSLLQSAWDKGTINPEMTWTEALRAAGYEGLIGTLGGATMSTAFHPFYKDMVDTAKETPNYPPWSATWKQGKPEVGKLWPEMVGEAQQEWLKPEQKVEPEAKQTEAVTPIRKWKNEEVTSYKGQKYKRFYSDNPRGKWLESERKWAAKSDVHASGSVTAGFHRVDLPTEMVASLKGERGEHKKIKQGDERVTTIADSMKEKGYDLNDDSPVFVTVDYQGNAKINEGNHRARAAIEAGLKTIPVEVRYFAGGELAEGKWSPSSLFEIEQAEPTPIKLKGFPKDPDAIAKPAPTKPNETLMTEFRKQGFSNPFLPSEVIVMNEAAGDESGAAIEAIPWGDNVHIKSIRALKRGEGNATNALNKIIDLADKHNVTLELDPKPYETTTKGKPLTLKQLEAWYGRHGFEYEDGQMVRAPKAKEPAKQTDWDTLPTDLKENVIGARDGMKVGTLSDFLQTDKQKKLYKDALDVPVRVLKTPIQDHARIQPMEGTVFRGALGKFQGTPTIFVNPSEVNEIIPTILEEGAHRLRELKGRMDAPQRLPQTEAEFDAYETRKEEVTAAKMVKHAQEKPEYTIDKARYAKKSIIIKAPSNASHTKTRAMRLAEHLHGRWSNREGGYIMSETKQQKFIDLFNDGRDASAVTGELYKKDGIDIEPNKPITFTPKRMQQMVKSAWPEFGRFWEDAGFKTPHEVLMGYENLDLELENHLPTYNKYLSKLPDGFDLNDVVKQYREDHAEPVKPKVVAKTVKPVKEAKPKTDDFKTWFADSKIVDKQGKPLVVYHGSGDANIVKFDPMRAGQEMTSDWGKGIYFTMSRNGADYYRKEAIANHDPVNEKLWNEMDAVSKKHGTTIMNAWIDLGSKKDAESQRKYKEIQAVDKKWRANLDKVREGKGGKVYAAHISMQNPMIYEYVGITDPYLPQIAKGQGHDGIIIVNEAVEGHLSDYIDEVVVLDPNQIRLVEEKAAPVKKKVAKKKAVKVDTKKLQAQVANLNKIADNLDKQIESKFDSGVSHQNMTPRRIRIANGMREDGEQMQRVQSIMRGIADGIESGTVDNTLAGIKNKKQVEILESNSNPKRHESARDWNRIGEESKTTLKRAGINGKNYGKALREARKLIQGPTPEQVKAKELKTLEQSLVGTKIAGFFPTPKDAVDTLLDRADIQEGESVLEPSAGMGNIADVIKERHPKATLFVNELNYTLNNILEKKGYDATQADFMDVPPLPNEDADYYYNSVKTDLQKRLKIQVPSRSMILQEAEKLSTKDGRTYRQVIEEGEKQAGFDKIVMNPPFEKGQDIDHVRHAYDLLKPNGRLVSIMSVSPFYHSGKKAQAFREWIDEVGAEVEDMDAGSFNKAELVRTTGVNSKIITIDKPALTEEIPTRLSRGGMAGGMGPVSAADVLGTQPQAQVAGTNLEPFLNKLNSAQDAKDVLMRAAKMFEGPTEMARRGKIPWKQTEQMARDYGFDHIVSRKVGEAWNPEQYEAARLFLDTAMTEITADAEKANETQSTEDLALFQNHLDKFVLAAQQMLGARAEWGRVGSIMRKQAMSSEYLTKVLDSMGDRETIAAKAKVLADLKAQGLSPEQLSKRATQLQTATTMQKVLEVWKVGLLTGLVTQAVNVGSNAVNAVLSIPEQFTAGVVSKFHGGEKVYLRESLYRSYGLVHGMIDGARYGWEAFKTGQPVFDTETKVHEISGRQRGAIGTDPDSGAFARHTGEIIRVPFRALTAGDEFFKAVARDMEVKAQSLRQAIKEGQSYARAEEIERQVTDLYGKQKPKTFFNPQEKVAWKIHDDVLDFSKYMTFQKELGQAGKKFTGLLREAPYLQFLAPFVRTPVNIVKYGVARTPAGLAMPSVREELRQGGATRDSAIARMVTGSGMMATIMYLAAQGMITGGGPTDPDKRRVWLQKYQPYSMKVNGKWYAYGRIEPLGFLFGIAADLETAQSQLAEDDVEGHAQVAEALSTLYASLVKNLASKTFLKGMTDAIAAYSDPDRYGKWWIGNMAGSTVPTLSAQVAAANDPYRRKANNILEKIQMRTIGQRQKLLPVRDMFGEPLASGETWGPRLLSPVYTKMDKDDPIVSELLSLEVYPSRPQKTIGGVKLSNEQYDRYLELSGKFARQQLDAIVSSPQYKQMPPFLQHDILAKTFTDGRTMARNILISEYPNLFPDQVIKKMEAMERKRK